jgi:hypothetical protein
VFISGLKKKVEIKLDENYKKQKTLFISVFNVKNLIMVCFNTGQGNVTATIVCWVVLHLLAVIGQKPFHT